MRKSLIITLIISITIITSAVLPAYQQSDEEQVKATLTAMWAAIEEGDIDAYADYIHPDITVFGENDTFLAEGKTMEVRNVRNWLKTAKGVHTDMHNAKVTVRSDTAWIVYYWTDSGLDNGVHFSSKGKSTRIFVKENGNWLCIHAHHTLVP